MISGLLYREIKPVSRDSAALNVIIREEANINVCLGDLGITHTLPKRLVDLKDMHFTWHFDPYPNDIGAANLITNYRDFKQARERIFSSHNASVCIIQNISVNPEPICVYKYEFRRK